ncbi:twin-arginine translocase TatA/TatE family subunit [Schwartzia sp. (in: firmicutes)]
MFGIGVPELLLILVIGLVVFGPGKLPEVGKAVGKGLREFKKATSAITADDEPEKEEPKKIVAKEENEVKPADEQTKKSGKQEKSKKAKKA